MAVGAATARGGSCARVGARERDRGGDEHGGEGVIGPGGCVAVSVALEGPRGCEAGREEATASPALATELLQGEGRKTTGRGGLGQVAGLGDWAGQVGCGKLCRFSVLFFLFLFSNSSVTLWVF